MKKALMMVVSIGFQKESVRSNDMILKVWGFNQNANAVVNEPSKLLTTEQMPSCCAQDFGFCLSNNPLRTSATKFGMNLKASQNVANKKSMIAILL